MKHLEIDGRLNGWDNLAQGSRRIKKRSPWQAIAEFINKTLIITELEVRKLRHDPTDLIVRAVQPVLWLLIFGQVFTRIRGIPTNGLPYLDFMAAGILAQSVLFVSIFSGGMSLIWERDLGLAHKFLVSPTPRAAIVLGKGIASGVRCLSQVFVVYLLSLVLGVQLNFSPIAMLGVLLMVMLGAACFSIFSIIVACLVKSREGFNGMGQLMTMPLFFASHAIYPIEIMPPWLQFVSRINPLTYQVDALRSVMLLNGTSIYGYGFDTAVLVLVLIVLTFIGGRLYRQIGM
ncbi:ABC transporter permease [Pseudanabaena mucicola]|uniref:Transport permease protein n=1 Tax=Pseudanabaena mucicola FACHB-723 TaxID=2692860 RepID=A0ABR8A1J4_9CYAN|nr:ABC transporter permease [Pseudanabaena mucicola]MBD2190112.1 ABC transporter permease [Pseudanabaena mucicola FACHB-723]